MNESPVTPPAARRESEELRRRCLQLRQLSRDLRNRSLAWREWRPTAPAATAASAPPAGRTDHTPRDGQTLLRAEADLEGAIRECRDALEEVRRELRWQEPVPPRVN